MQHKTLIDGPPKASWRLSMSLIRSNGHPVGGGEDLKDEEGFFELFELSRDGADGWRHERKTVKTCHVPRHVPDVPFSKSTPVLAKAASAHLHTRLAHFPISPRYPMSATNQTAGPSSDNFTAIFNAALIEYQTLTGKPLDTHLFAVQLDTCQNPEAASNLLRTQAQTFSKSREDDERLMAWLDPTINILSTFSDTLRECINLVSNLVHLHMVVL